MRSRNCKFIIISMFLFAGCATVGPYVDYQELRGMNYDLRIKALKLRIKRSIYVNDIGFKLLDSLPERPGKSYGYLGILATSLDKYVARIFGKISDEDRVIIYGFAGDSPAEKAGLKEGDIIFKVNNMEISSYNFGSVVTTMKPAVAYRFEVERNNDILEFDVYPRRVAYRINFLVVAAQEVNAAAFPGGVAVTYGLLNFIKDDDELGIVLGHELAHLIKGHILKSQGLDLITAILAAALGKNVDIPQSGELGRLLGSAFSAGFSRDFEREADFLGTLLAYKAGFDIDKGIYVWERFAVELPQSLDTNFLAGHPTSSERLLRIEKITEGIKNGSIRVDDYLN